MIFKYNSIVDIKKIQNFTRIKKFEILDFGCGTGIWSQKNLDAELKSGFELFKVATSSPLIYAVNNWPPEPADLVIAK